MGSRECTGCGHLFFAHGPNGCVTCGCTAVRGGLVRGDSPTAAQDLLAMLEPILAEVGQREEPTRSSTTLGDVLTREGVPGIPSALYLSAGSDMMPFSFLSPAFLAHRGFEGVPWPELFVYVDRSDPRGSDPRLSFRDDHGTVVRTVSHEELTVGKEPAWLLDVEATAEDPSQELRAKVLRIRARNQDVLPMVARAGWVPDVVITVCDGCAFGGQEGGRCENDLAAPTSIGAFLGGPPRWWVTDHWRPHGLLPRLPGYLSWSFRRVGPLSSDWGHPWMPLHGANLFEVTG